MTTHPTPRTLHIYYRHVHIKTDKTSRDPNKARPEWFSHENCFRNLMKTVLRDPQAQRVIVNIIYDGPAQDFQDDFIAKYCANPELRLQTRLIAGGSDKNSSLITLHLAHTDALQPEDLVYMLENDYLHQDGWVSKVLEAFDSGLPFQYLSLYDHQDKYNYAMYEGLRSKVMHTASHHWRTVPSSCASYLMERRTLDADYDILSQGLPDYYFFNILTDERQRVLVTPVPGLSTHCMAGYLSPVVSWDRMAQDAAAD